MSEVTSLTPNRSHTEKLVYFPRRDGARIPYEVYTSPEIYELELERIFRRPPWSFVALEAELPNARDFKSTFVGATPVVVTRNEDSSLSVWVNRCAHRGAMVCRAARGNARTHICACHQWSYDTRGNLRGVPFRRGLKDSPGMLADFDPKEHGLQQLRIESYRGLVFATFSEQTPSLDAYLGSQMIRGLDRIFHKPIVYLGCTRQHSQSNWKLYSENVRDPYHASLLHAFLSTLPSVQHYQDCPTRGLAFGSANRSSIRSGLNSGRDRPRRGSHFYCYVLPNAGVDKLGGSNEYRNGDNPISAAAMDYGKRFARADHRR